MFVNVLSIFCIVSIIVGLYVTYVIINRHYNYIKYGDYPVKHRINENGVFQYSVGCNLWTDICVYNNDNSNPNLIYLKINWDEYKEWCNRLSTMKKCHDFNRKELQTYIAALQKYLGINEYIN